MLSIQMNDRTVEDVFEYIEKNSEFIFVYHGSNIDLHRKVNLDVRDQSVEIILDKLFSGTDIEYIINNRQIIVRRDTKKRIYRLLINRRKGKNNRCRERCSRGSSDWCECSRKRND